MNKYKIGDYVRVIRTPIVVSADPFERIVANGTIIDTDGYNCVVLMDTGSKTNVRFDNIELLRREE